MSLITHVSTLVLKSKPLLAGLSLCLILSTGCTEGIPGSTTQNVDTSSISSELLALSSTYENKDYNYVGLMAYLNCAADKSSLPIIQTLAESARKDLVKAFASNSTGTAQAGLAAQLKRAATAPPDPGLLLSCKLEPISTTDTTSSATEIPTSATEAPTSTTQETLKIEVETGTKTSGELKYPVSESRGAGIKVMMFSGGDAGSQATLTLPELKGKYRVELNWLNSSDSPAMALKAQGLTATLPAATESTSNGSLVIRDLGEFDLDISAGDTMTFTVMGNTKGKGNAWIGLDYIRFTALNT